MSKPRVLVSIVDRNGGAALHLCLSTLLDSRYKAFSIVVLDSDSAMDPVGPLRKLFPQVEVVRNGADLGFGVAQPRRPPKFPHLWPPQTPPL
jgi:GT2 family glycosyltransferase